MISNLYAYIAKLKMLNIEYIKTQVQNVVYIKDSNDITKAFNAITGDVIVDADKPDGKFKLIDNSLTLSIISLKDEKVNFHIINNLFATATKLDLKKTIILGEISFSRIQEQNNDTVFRISEYTKPSITDDIEEETDLLRVAAILLPKEYHDSYTQALFFNVNTNNGRIFGMTACRYYSDSTKYKMWFDKFSSVLIFYKQSNRLFRINIHNLKDTIIKRYYSISKLSYLKDDYKYTSNGLLDSEIRVKELSDRTIINTYEWGIDTKYYDKTNIISTEIILYDNAISIVVEYYTIKDEARRQSEIDSIPGIEYSPYDKRLASRIEKLEEVYKL